MSKLTISVVDSEKVIYEGEVSYLIAPSVDGEIGIFPHHIPILTKLKPGVLRMQVEDDIPQEILAISGGFLEVCNNKATVLADITERSDKLDRMKLEEQLALARKQEEDSKEVNKVSIEILLAQLKLLDYLEKTKKH